jgi:hypothetical protein
MNALGQEKGRTLLRPPVESCVRRSRASPLVEGRAGNPDKLSMHVSDERIVPEEASDTLGDTENYLFADSAREDAAAKDEGEKAADCFRKWRLDDSE